MTSRLQVVHHTDYRSKAEGRKKELEELQEKGLARTKGKTQNIVRKSIRRMELISRIPNDRM